MRKFFLSFLIFLFSVSSFKSLAFTSDEITKIYENERNETVRELGTAMLKKELGFDRKDNDRAIGRYRRVDEDFITMVSLITNRTLNVSDVTEDHFTIHLSKDNNYDDNYYKERANDLELLLKHIDIVKALTATMNDHDKIVFLNNYISYQFQYDNTCSLSDSAVTGFKTGRTDCKGYTASFYILGLNTGINVRAECVLNSQGYHTFNVVELDGRDLVVDVSSNDLYSTDMFLLIPYTDYISITGSTELKDSISSVKIQYKK